MINNQNCFAVNMGFNGEIPFPTLTLTVDAQENLEKYGIDRFYKCFYVFVGGKYVDDMENVVEIVEGVTGKFHGIRPKALFIMGKYGTDRINELSKQTKNLTMVHINLFLILSS